MTTIHHATAKKAAAHNIVLTQEGNDGWMAKTENDYFVLDGNPKIALLLAIQAIEADNEFELDHIDDHDVGEEEPTSKAIVKRKFRQRYAELGDKSHCGDRLALWMKGRYDLNDPVQREAYLGLLAANGVDTGAVAFQQINGTRGWQGRVKMSGNTMLRAAIKKQGALFDAGKQVAY